jgi:Putative beta-barrel porin-2, OmpL-like. bbp2
MKKLLLASAVSAAFAAPGVVFAQAKPPAAPTLDKVLEASGISVSGYMDVAYTHSDRDLSKFSDRVFDSQNNSFALHQFGLTVAKQPKEGFGGLVNLTVGSDAQVIHSFPETNTATPPANSTSMFDVTQGYLQYATGPLTVIAGKYATMHGTEVIASTGNTNFSRSILFGAVPFTHTGVRATWVLNDKVSLMGGVNNGWDQLTDANKGKTLELGTTLTPIKPLTITVSGMSGKEPTTATTDGTRNSINAVASYTIIDPLSVGLEVLSVSQDNVGGLGTKQKYSGAAGYVTYMFMPKLRGVLRVESFNDKDGFHFATPNAKYREGTATVSYLASDSFEARAEVRHDSSDKTVFFKSGSGTADSKSMSSIALQALYKF